MAITPLPKIATRDTVFIAGGQPSVTYVDRAHLKIEDAVSRALKVPNQIVSLAGPTKSGKTVLFRKVLANAPYIWLEGGQLETSTHIWEKICYVLNYPIEIAKNTKGEAKVGITIGVKDFLAVDGSLLKGSEATRTYRIDTMASAIRHLSEQKVALVIDAPCCARQITRAEKSAASLCLQLWGFTGNGVWTDSVQGAAENKFDDRLSTDELRQVVENTEDLFSPRWIDSYVQRSERYFLATRKYFLRRRISKPDL